MPSSSPLPYANHTARVAALLFAVLPLLAQGETVPLPQAIQPDRYQPIWTRSPFTIASADDAPKGTWALVGLTQNGGYPLAILFNRQTQERLTVTKTPNEKGFAVEAVDFNPDLLQSSARIKTPSETLTVRFDQALTVVDNPAPQPSGNPAVAPGQPHPTVSATIPRPPASGTPPRSLISRTVIPHPLSKPQAPTP